MARDECWDALKEHARQNHRERVAKNPDRIEYAIWAGTGKILGYTQRGIHNLIRICEEE